MKKAGTIIILAVILLALVVSLLVLVIHNREDDTPETEVSVAVGGIEKADSVTYTANDGQQLTFTLDGDTWYYADDHDFPVTQTFITRITNIVNSCTAERAFYAVDLAEYGLDNPQKILTVTEGNKSVTYALSTSSGGVCYASVGDGNVYVLGSNLTNVVGLGLNDIIASEAMPTVKEDEIDTISIIASEKSLELSSAKDKSGNISWYVVTDDKVKTTDLPDVDGVSATAYVKNMLSALKNMRTNGVAEYKPESLATYGLDMSLTISVASTGESGNYTLLVGRTETGYFITLPGSTRVYNLHETIAEPIYAAFDALAE